MPRLSPGHLKAAVYGSELLLALLAAAALGRPLRLPSGDGPQRRAVECSLVILTMLLVSPMSSKPHFCLMLLPAMLLARRAVTGDKPVTGNMLAAIALAICIIAVDLLDRSIVGPRLGQWAMWHGSVTWGALAVWPPAAFDPLARQGFINKTPPIHYQVNQGNGK